MRMENYKELTKQFTYSTFFQLLLREGTHTHIYTSTYLHFLFLGYYHDRVILVTVHTQIYTLAFIHFQFSKTAYTPTKLVLDSLMRMRSY